MPVTINAMALVQFSSGDSGIRGNDTFKKVEQE